MPRVPSDSGDWRLWKLSQLRPASDFWLIADGVFGHSRSSQQWGVHARHGQGRFSNMLFADAHAEPIDVSTWTGFVWSNSDYDEVTGRDSSAVYPRWRVP
jgi:prepilin-type processing-associated H-X9-DG protein